jgi:carboxyl-terminal processing protease
MTKMNSNWMRAFIIAVSAAILALAAFGAGMAVGASFGGDDVQSASLQDLPALLNSTPAAVKAGATVTATVEPDLGLDAQLFDEAMSLLETQFYGELPQGEDVTYNAIRGVVDRLGDRNTAFVDPETAALFNADMEGAFEGIGARVGLAEMGGVLIEYLFPEQPAERAGLQVGDIILEVDGQDVTQMGLTEAIGLIRGPKGSEVTLTLVRQGAEEPLDIEVTRARIELPVVTSKTLADGKIEYISLAEFSSVAPQRLAQAVRSALDKKPEGLILDLRGNPGGLLDASVQIGSYFVPQGNILLERMKDGETKEYARRGRYLLGDTPLVVLVDGGSASASEIVAGAVQDAGTGVLIGEKTFGKGSVQLPNMLSDGSQLRVTIAHWFTPKDRGIHELGLEPDIAVPLTQEDREAERDPQLDRAVEYLLEGK